MATAKRTNTVKFGKFAIVLEKDQLMYYTGGELSKVRDVNPSFNNNDLYDLAVRITEKNEYGPVENTTKDKVVKKF
jgi:hypothetical protein